jgi:SAM-dependent methyltransferase
MNVRNSTTLPSPPQTVAPAAPSSLAETREQGPAPLPSREALQEEQYGFPYHHIPVGDDRAFRHFRLYPSALEYISYVRLLTDRIAAMSVESVIDVGCGDGRLCLQMRSAMPHVQITGVDISQQATALARLLVPGCRFLCGDIADPTFIPQRFDVATLVEVLEHVEPVRAPDFLQAVRRLLRPGGTLLLTVPSTRLPVSAKHYRHFDEPLLREVLTPCFDVQEIVFLNRLGLRADILYHLMYNNLLLVAHPRLLGWFLRYYERTCLPADRHNGVRLLAVCRSRG